MASPTRALIACLSLLALAAPARAQTADVTWTEVAPPFTRIANSAFGNQLRWDGDHALIGSNGRIDVYRFDGASAPVWESQLTPTIATTGYPGACAIDHGRALVVANTDASGQFVYEFTPSGVGTTWTDITHVLNPAPHVGDGTLVALAIDGSRWAVSAPYISSNAGEVDLIRSPTTDTITWTTSNRSVVFGPGRFTGHVLAMRGADLLVSVIEATVGGTVAGLVTLYHDTGSALTPVVTIDNPSPAHLDQFGVGAALDDTYLYIGSHYDDTMAPDAGAVYVYDRAGASVQTIYGTVPFGRFGGSISVDGDWMVISAATTFASPGLAHLFLYHRDAGGTWRQSAVLADMNGASATYFGLDTQLRSRVLLASAFQATAGGVSRGGRVWYGTISVRDGGDCSVDADCAHAHCISGICCNIACSGCSACGTGTCVPMTCDAGIDAGSDAAIAAIDAGTDAAMSTSDGGSLPELDAGGLHDASAPDAGRDAGVAPDALVHTDAASGADAGGVPRVALSCTCRASGPSSSGLALLGLGLLLIGSRGRNALRRR